MTTHNRFRRLAATVAVSALPLAGVSALITAQPAAAQFAPFDPFGTTGFGGGGINFHPDNSTTEVNNFGNNNSTVIDDGSGRSNWDFPWWNDSWDWNPGWDGGPWGGGGWNGGGWNGGGWW